MTATVSSQLAVQSTAPKLAPRATPPRRVDVNTILGSDQIVMIEHGVERYFLRRTRNNKLILTK